MSVGVRNRAVEGDDRAFPRHTLDGAAVRAALLDAVVTLAHQLRRRGQAARGLTLILRFAGGTTWDKTRRFTEASAHDDGLRTTAYRLIDAAGLQRGRITGVPLKAEDLIAAEQVVEQISLDQAREARLAAEEVSDRIRAKFGPDAVRPATTLLRVG
ncbi:DinB/UmuC family translesion DNA polymerase [Streptomyces sp. NPDC001443]